MITFSKLVNFKGFIKQKPSGYFWYVTKFISTFLFLYLGTLLIIGLSSKENLYSPFVAHLLDYVSPLRQSLLIGCNFFINVLGYHTHYLDQFTLTINGGKGVRIVYSCVGYGVMSFWAAFVIANKGHIGSKIAWLVIGWTALWILNVFRLSLLLLADIKNWQIPFGIDHHTLFNIFAYGAIFLLMYIYDRNKKDDNTPTVAL